VDSGAEDTFRSAYQTYYRVVLAFATRRTASRADAEDIAGETFAVAWRRIDQMPGEVLEQKPWLFSIARYVLSNHYRGRSRANRLSELLSVTAPMPAEAADAGIEDRSDLADALHALFALDEKDQEILLLALWEELSIAEIAKVMHLSRPNVSVRLHRARWRLRAKFESQLQEPRVAGHIPPRRATGDVAEKESTG